MKHLALISKEFAKVAVAYPKWWSRLTYDEQKEYIKDHRGTQLRVTAPKSLLTGQEPITTSHYSIKGRLTDSNGNPISGVIHETIDALDNKFSGAETLQDLVDKIQQSRPGFKLLRIRPKKKKTTTSDNSNSTKSKQSEPVISDKPLVVGNMAQKILFLTEMQGQISDGQWENISGNHWQEWSNLDWDSIGIGDNIGRKFHTVRDGYNFTNRELIDIVGDRMLQRVNLYKKYPDIVGPILEKDHWLIPDSYEEAKSLLTQKQTDDFWKKKKQKLIYAGLTLDKFKEAKDNPVYTRADMMRDLRGLKKSIKPEGRYGQVQS